MTFPQNCKFLPRLGVTAAFFGLFPLLLPAFAQNAGDNSANIDRFARITVGASGVASAKPDMALLQISVSHEAKTAKNAAEDTARAAQTLLAALKKQNIDDKDIQSNGLIVDRIYQQEGAKAKREKIFRARTALNVKIRDISRLGRVIDEAIANGATGLGDVSWTNSDLKPLYAAARQQAVHNALEKIKSYTQAAGVTAGRILRIEELSDDSPSPRFHAARAKAPMAMAADVPVAEGEENYAVRISLTQELINKEP